jgi:hypothetical protein
LKNDEKFGEYEVVRKGLVYPTPLRLKSLKNRQKGRLKTTVWTLMGFIGRLAYIQ